MKTILRTPEKEIERRHKHASLDCQQGGGAGGGLSLSLSSLSHPKGKVEGMQISRDLTLPDAMRHSILQTRLGGEGEQPSSHRGTLLERGGKHSFLRCVSVLGRG